MDSSANSNNLHVTFDENVQLCVASHDPCLLCSVSYPYHHAKLKVCSQPPNFCAAGVSSPLTTIIDFHSLFLRQFFVAFCFSLVKPPCHWQASEKMPANSPTITRHQQGRDAAFPLGRGFVRLTSIFGRTALPETALSLFLDGLDR